MYHFLKYYNYEYSTMKVKRILSIKDLLDTILETIYKLILMKF